MNEGSEYCIAQVALLCALAHIMRQLPSISESTVQQCLEVVDRIGRAYAWQWPKQRPRVHAALCELLGALASKQALLMGFLPQFVACLLAHTLQPPEAGTVQLGRPRMTPSCDFRVSTPATAAF